MSMDQEDSHNFSLHFREPRLFYYFVDPNWVAGSTRDLRLSSWQSWQPPHIWCCLLGGPTSVSFWGRIARSSAIYEVHFLANYYYWQLLQILYLIQNLSQKYFGLQYFTV